METAKIIKRFSPQHLFLTLLLGTSALGGCASTGVGSQPLTGSKTDPYEHINRKIFTFNDKVDSYIAEPVSDVYRWITPEFVQTGVFNFYNNLKNINVVANDVLQGKFKQGARDTGRFLMNSTLGMLGLIDVAKSAGLEQNDEDFEQTLAVWGVPRGPYLVLPILGPTTGRGIPGALVDTAANPTSYVGAPVQLLSLLNTRANAEGSLKFIDEASLYPYIFTRESYLQWRQGLATDGKAQASAEFDAELEDGGDSLENNGLSDYRKLFGKAADSLDNTTRLFEQTAKTMSDSGEKAEAIKFRPRRR